MNISFVTDDGMSSTAVGKVGHLGGYFLRQVQAKCPCRSWPHAYKEGEQSALFGMTGAWLQFEWEGPLPLNKGKVGTRRNTFYYFNTCYHCWQKEKDGGGWYDLQMPLSFSQGEFERKLGNHFLKLRQHRYLAFVPRFIESRCVLILYLFVWLEQWRTSITCRKHH